MNSSEVQQVLTLLLILPRLFLGGGNPKFPNPLYESLNFHMKSIHAA